MSKKTRKKSPTASLKKPPSKKPARAVSKTSAKKLQTSRPPAKTPAKKSAEAHASAAALHKATSKKLKADAPQKSVAAAAAEAKAAARPRSENPSARKQPDPQAAAAPGKAALLTEGAKAPAFRLPRDGGNSVSLADYAGQKLVIFFYPRADTPGCTKEAIEFTRLSGAFGEVQTAVLGVSADPLRAQEAFRDKHQLSIPLASDEKHEMLEAYGVWGEKSMYGKTFLGIVRTTVLIGIDGRIARTWRNVKVDGHADEVLAAARAL
ncbi:peroxiredoxin [Bradyrhizobium sp.]|uniref:peroxiredoxin n=1 Tax=Bradyrhizobium sp. TaxID=376 RepID=UPI002E01FD06|nr:peroxiredoxin [Bradyrhizobium sp.]